MTRKDTIEALRASIANVDAISSSWLDSNDDASFDLFSDASNNEELNSENSYFDRKSNANEEKAESKRLDAFSKIVGLLNASEKSEKTIRERLQRDGYNEIESEQAIERAKEYGFIDDARFGKLLIESRIRQGHGSSGIERELKKNDIDPWLIEGWPQDFKISYEEELERALTLLRKKPPRSKNLREGAYRKAVSKGFPANVASSAARIWVEEVSR